MFNNKHIDVKEIKENEMSNNRFDELFGQMVYRINIKVNHLFMRPMY